MTIAAILRGKGRDVVQVRSTDTVLSAVQLLADRRIGCVPVGDLMTSPAITVDDKMPVIHGLSLMTKRRIRHLPVVVDGQLVGLISIGDLVKFRIDSIESEASALRDYIQTA